MKKINKETFFKNYIANISIIIMLCMVATVTLNWGSVSVIGNKNDDPIYIGNKNSSYVSLMFNVYWGTEYIDDILKVLDKYNVKTTFFVGGTWAEKEQEVFIFEKNNLSAKPLCLSVPDVLEKNEFHLYKIVNIAGRIYGVFPGTIDGKRKVRFAEIDIDEKAIKSLDVVMDFDLTETIYPRGNRLYLMKSRNISNVFYTYYDFETGEIGEIINIKYEDIIGE